MAAFHHAKMTLSSMLTAENGVSTFICPPFDIGTQDTSQNTAKNPRLKHQPEVLLHYLLAAAIIAAAAIPAAAAVAAATAVSTAAAVTKAKPIAAAAADQKKNDDNP